VALALLVTTSVHAARPEPYRARLLEQHGRKLFFKKDYFGALRAFQSSYESDPTNFFMQCNIARCHQLRGDLGLAVRHFMRCLDEGADRTPKRKQVEGALARVHGDLKRGGPPRDKKRDHGPGPLLFTRTKTSEERPYFGEVAIGGAFKIGDVPSQLKLALLSLGYHLTGKGHGPAFGVDFQLGLAAGTTSVEIGPRFLWDFLIPWRYSHRFFISPTATLGFAQVGDRCVGSTCAASRYGLTFQFGVDLKMVLEDRYLLYFRPIGFDVLSTGNDNWKTSLRYDLLFGAGLVFGGK
jgi:hypothetical protein